MQTLFHHPFCPHSRFIRLALGEYGIEPRLVEEKVWDRREDFLVLNPAGTTPVMSARSSGGVQVEGEVDPTDWSGGLAVRTFGEGECAFSCLAIQECPEGTWPVFSYSCFTCATLNSRGEVVQGSCGTSGVSGGGSSPPPPSKSCAGDPKIA